VEESVLATQEELLIAAVLTALICFLFLGTFSSGFNIILSIPTSIIGTFTILYFSGFTLNTFTLLALALAIGIVVDDAIMVLENVVRHFHQGKDRIQAALDGAREVTFAATAASVAVIAIFLPVAFMDGRDRPLFLSVRHHGDRRGGVVAAGGHHAHAHAVVADDGAPGTAGLAGGAANRTFDAIGRAYRATLRLALAVAGAGGGGQPGGVCGIPVAGPRPAPRICAAPGPEFHPHAHPDLPVGSSLAFTDAKTREVEAYLKSRPEVLRYFVAVGGINGVPNQSFAAVTLVDKQTSGKKARPS
jgi:hypothetical protein